MIIGIIAPPAHGKSSLLTSIINDLPGAPEFTEPQKLFRCTKYDDILCLGQHDSTEHSGLDAWSYSILGKGVFENFITEQVKAYRHILWEGDRIASKCEYMTENFITRIFMLSITKEQEKIRQDARGNKQNKQWIAGRHTQLERYLTNFYLREHITVMPNNNLEEQNKIKNEIIKLLKEH